MGHSESGEALSTAIVRVSVLGFQFVHFVSLEKQLKDKRSLHERTNDTWMQDYRDRRESNTRLKSSEKAI
jgi:hypothetical protein